MEMEMEMEALKLSKGDEPVLAAPLIEVFAITIHRMDNNNTDMMKTYEIYGDVQITDGEGATFDLYSRQPDNPETVHISEPLSLTFLKDRAISPRGVVVVNVNLMDKAQNMAIAKGRCVWDYAVKNDYEEVQTERFDGEHSFYADLTYITYRCAVIANLEVALCNEKGNGNSNSFPDDDAEVYGSIVASHVNRYRCLKSGVREKGHSRIVLFSASEIQPVRVKFGTCFQLSRYVVVVPAYSYLIIEAQLVDFKTKRRIVWSPIAIGAQAYGNSKLTKDLIQVRIRWDHACTQPPPARILKHRRETSSRGEKEDSKIEVEERNKKPRIPSQQAPPTALSSKWASPRIRLEQSGMEVFSVFVGDWVSKLHGSISMTDNYSYPTGDLIVYKRDERLPEELSQDSKIASIGIRGTHRSIKGDTFIIILDLKDDQGRQVCYGHEHWKDDWCGHFGFGKRLCSVITGEYGYAAVHYTVFPTALPATVSVSFFAMGSSCSNSDAKFNIYGRIVSEYGSDTCLTHYEKEFYRSRLFVGSATDPLKDLESGSEILLSKSQVVVPEKSSLIIDADLYVVVAGEEGGVVRFQGSEKFESDGREVVSKRIQGQRFYLEVSVKWGRVFSLAKSR